MDGSRSSAAPPAVSVIVPAHNAEATLPGTLAGLARQDGAPPFEVIVADDRSTDATAELARASGALVVPCGEGRPGSTRNAGVRASSAPLLAFLDADCEPTPGWLAAGVGALAQADLVQGMVTAPPGVPVGPWDRTLSVGRLSPLYESANLFVRREWFERIGGFQDWIAPAGIAVRLPGRRIELVAPGHFGEDLWFGWRASRAGARVAFSADARVYHAVFRRRAWQFAAERTRLSLFPEAVRLVPELRDRLLWCRWFLSPRTAAFDAAVVAALAGLARRSALPAVAAVPYVLIVARDALGHPPRARLKGAVGAVAADAIGSVALVRGSLLAREVVL